MQVTASLINSGQFQPQKSATKRQTANIVSSGATWCGTVTALTAAAQMCRTCCTVYLSNCDLDTRANTASPG